jgi:hypothetical protein
VPEFLSETWIRELDRSVRSAARVPALAPFVIEQVVSGVPGRGEVRYRLRITEDGGRVTDVSPDIDHIATTAVDAEPFDVRLTTDYPTAVAISLGHENAQIALSRGRLRLGGNVETLIRRSDALAALDDATAELRAATTYPPSPSP